jgi:hypothetical protein
MEVGSGTGLGSAGNVTMDEVEVEGKIVSVSPRPDVGVLRIGLKSAI